MPKWLEILLYIHLGIAVIDLTLIAYSMGKSLNVLYKNGTKSLSLAITLFTVCLIPLVNILVLFILFIVITLNEMIYKERQRVNSIAQNDAV